MKKAIFILILIIPLLVISQQVIPTSTQNYIHKIVYKKGFTTAYIHQATNDEKIEIIQYYDGLGRPVQSIAVKQGGNDKDVITHIEYDAYGRQVMDYLPYAENNPSGLNMGKFVFNALDSVETFYNTDAYENTTNPYAEKQFESSPLNRVLKQAAPGEDWKLGNGHEIEFDYQSNATDEVKLYTVTLTTTDYIPTLVDSGHYDANTLYKNIIRDENHDGSTTKNHTTDEFKDKQGRVVLKRAYNNDVNHDTYYVYDDYGNLTYVLPPKVKDTTGIPNSTELTELCYQYRYDSRNRLIEKQIPGKGREYIVYNKLDQPVLTRDKIQDDNNQWLFSKYDAFGRVVYTGLKNVSDTIYDRNYFQNLIDNSTSATQFENKTSSSFSVGGTPVYYTKTAVPLVMDEIYTVNYYDNYDHMDLSGGTRPSSVYGVSTTTKTKGLPTVSKVRVLGTSSWITTVTYYDDYKRPIYVYSKNDYLGTTDIVESKFIEDGYTNDIRGLVHETKTTHQKGTTDIVTISKFTYDHSGKLLSQTQNINNQGEETIAVNEYDDLGQLKRKKVGGTNNNELQIVDYTYNIRGWLKQINDVNNLGTTDLFAFNINYNDIADVNKRLYNGNISQTNWNSASINNTSNPESNQYVYTYDQLNRITSGIDNTENYNLDLVEYDKNGNITKLKRQGHRNTAATSFGTMDDLTYTYDSGNKLMKVADAATIDQFGFKDDAINTAADTSDDYSYDNNGNMTKDLNKSISSITYNHLNLPKKITIKRSVTPEYIEYVYDANGVKLEKKVSIQGFYGYTETYTMYAGNYVYVKVGTGPNELQFFNTPEGYVSPVNAADYSLGFNYVYQYKDHLGNIRLSYSDANNNGTIEVTSDPLTTEIIEENNYYPLGLKHKGYNYNVTSTNPAQKYKYNGKELQDELDLNWYDFHARFYMADLGRTTTQDPHAENYYSESSYSFMGNNPIVNVDPTGMDWFYYKKEGEEDVSWNWHKGSEYNHTYTYTEDGEEKTGNIALQGYEYLVEYSITGNNDEGSSVGTINVFKQQDIVASQDGVFTGTNQYSGTASADKGTYFMALNIRDADGPQKMNDDESNPEAAWGMQKIPNNTIIPMRSDPTRGYSINASYGNGRVRLIPSEQVSNNNLLRYGYKDRGLYLHGKKDPRNWTHGCVCDKSGAIFNYLWSNVRKRTPFVVK